MGEVATVANEGRHEAGIEKGGGNGEELGMEGGEGVGQGYAGLRRQGRGKEEGEGG